MTEPYFPAKPGDTIKSSEWNELQARLRGEVYSHTHSGAEQGVKLRGDSIAADAALQVKEVRTLGLTVGTESQFVVNAAGKVAIGAADPGDDSLRVAGPVRATSLAADTVIAGHLEGLKDLALDGLDAREVRAKRLAVAEAAGLKDLQAERVRADELAAGAVITPTIRGDGVLTVGSALTVAAALKVTGPASLDAGLTVAGPAATGGLAVSGASSLAGGLTVAGTTRVEGLAASGATSLAGLSTSGPAALAELSVSGSASLKGGVAVAGAAVVDGPLTAHGAAEFTQLVVSPKGGSHALVHNYMAAGSLTIGSIQTSFGGGRGFSANTAGLLLETKASTEIAVHDSDHRVISLLHYEGDDANRVTLGRDMGWGPPNAVAIASALDLRGPLRLAAPKGDDAVETTIATRTIPEGQGQANERSELIIFHGNDGSNRAGPDTITLRAPEIRLQTYDDADVYDIRNAAGSNDRLVISPQGSVRVVGELNVGGTLRVGGTIDVAGGLVGEELTLRGALRATGRAAIVGDLVLGHGWSGAVSTVKVGKSDAGGNWGGGSAFIEFADSDEDGANKGTSVAIATHTWGLGTAEALRIAANRNVGIGTATPTARLEVAGSVKATEELEIGGRARVVGDLAVGRGWGDGGMSAVTLGKSDGAGAWGPGAAFIRFADSDEDGANKGTSVAIATHMWGGGTVEALRIAANRNVGVGTATPSERLEVAGNIKATGNVQAAALGVAGALHAVTVDAARFEIRDNRGETPAPASYHKAMHLEFKECGVIGLHGSGGYAAVLTMAPWYDASGGPVHQLAFSDTGVFHRLGPQGGGWQPWRSIALT